jgi:DNA polymerase III subunit gamma/tau
MRQALYRKYRSQTLDEVVGQEHITNTLKRAIEVGQISHAYLFTGPRGVGKTSVARILAREINGLSSTDDQHLDIIEIDAASNRRIDDIRELREKVHIAPISARYKVYIIDEVHMLTGESFNALLKTLEEPPAHVVFILATTESHKLPATIISRTQRYAFRPAAEDKLVEHLRHIAHHESIDIDDQALALVAKHGDGSFRDSISLLDQLANITSGQQITREAVIDNLGLAPHERINDIVKNLNTGGYIAVTAALVAIQSQGVAISTIVTQLCDELVEQAADDPSLYALMDKLLDVPRAFDPSLKLLTVLALHCVPAKVIRNTTAPLVKTVVSSPPEQVVAEPEKPKEGTDSPLVMNGDVMDKWPDVLQELRAANQALYAIAKQAKPELDDETLTLNFKFALHSKKLDGATQKELLGDVIKKVTGRNYILKTAVNKVAASSSELVSADVSSVSDIMGGGEVVDPPLL